MDRISPSDGDDMGSTPGLEHHIFILQKKIAYDKM